jgi:hypothetical protein
VVNPGGPQPEWRSRLQRGKEKLKGRKAEQISHRAMAGVLQAHRHVGDADIAIMNLIMEMVQKGFREGSVRVQGSDRVQEFTNVLPFLNL